MWPVPAPCQKRASAVIQAEVVLGPQEALSIVQRSPGRSRPIPPARVAGRCEGEEVGPAPTRPGARVRNHQPALEAGLRSSRPATPATQSYRRGPLAPSPALSAVQSPDIQLGGHGRPGRYLDELPASSKENLSVWLERYARRKAGPPLPTKQSERSAVVRAMEGIGQHPGARARPAIQPTGRSSPR